MTFLQFYINFKIFFKNFYIIFGINNPIEYIFLNYVYMFKTSNILFIRSTLLNSSLCNLQNVFLIQVNTSKDTLNNFLKRFDGSSSHEESKSFFLNFWKKKINTYKLLCLGNLSKNFIIVNKKLITSPKFSSSSIAKYLSTQQLNSFEFQFLRKNKVYNKGRYSRCRQNYRTGVYLCMYLSIVCIFGLYYWFYKFSFNFTYLWWLFIVFVGSFFIPKIIKYRLYEPTTILNKFFGFFKWASLLLKSFF